MVTFTIKKHLIGVLLIAASAFGQKTTRLDIWPSNSTTPGTIQLYSNFSAFTSIKPVAGGFKFDGNIFPVTDGTSYIGGTNAQTGTGRKSFNFIGNYIEIAPATAGGYAMSVQNGIIYLGATAGSVAGTGAYPFDSSAARKVEFVDATTSFFWDAQASQTGTGADSNWRLRDGAGAERARFNSATAGAVDQYGKIAGDWLSDTTARSIGRTGAGWGGMFLNGSINFETAAISILPTASLDASSIGSNSRRWTTGYYNNMNVSTQFRLTTGATWIMPDLAGAGKVWTSDASGFGTWQVTAGGGGVSSLTAGGGISLSGSTGAVTVANAGLTLLLAGTGISVSSGTGTSTVSVTGVALTGAAGGGQTLGSSGSRLTHVLLDNLSAYSSLFIKNGATLNLQSGSTVTAPNGSTGFTGACSGAPTVVSAGIITSC